MQSARVFFPQFLCDIEIFWRFFQKISKISQIYITKPKSPNFFCWKRKQTTGSTKDHAHGQH